MNHQLICLKFTSELAAKNALPFLRDPDGKWIKDHVQWNFDPVGKIISTPGIYDLNGEVKAPTYKSGWHCNLLATPGIVAMVPPDFIVAVDTPARTFAAEE